MKIVKHTFYANRKIRLKDLEGHQLKQVRDYERVLRDLHPIARRISHAIPNRSVDNRTWQVEFYVD